MNKEDAEETLAELSKLAANPVDLILAACDMLGWDFASNGDVESGTSVLLMGPKDAMNAVFDGEDGEWTIFPYIDEDMQ